MSGVPPSDGAADGDTWLTAAAGWYVYRAPPAAYCCPLMLTATFATPSVPDGVKHWINVLSMYLAVTDRCPSPFDALLLLSSKPHRMVCASRKPCPTMSTLDPPTSGPNGGVTN